MTWFANFVGAWFSTWFGGAADPLAIYATGTCGASGSCELGVLRLHAPVQESGAGLFAHVRRRLVAMWAKGFAGATGWARALVFNRVSAQGRSKPIYRAAAGTLSRTSAHGVSRSIGTASPKNFATIRATGTSGASSTAKAGVRRNDDDDVLALILALNDHRKAA